MENQSLDAFKLTRIRPTPAGLADCKDTRYDCSMMIGLCNPYSMEVKSFLGYDISKLRDHQRFFEVMLSRYGTSNSITALYFDGAVSYFKELPRPDELDLLARIYNYIDSIKRKPRPQQTSKILLVFSKISKRIRRIPQTF